MTRAERADFAVRAADWRTDRPGIAAIRRAVFIEEQGVPESMEWEAIDAECAWYVAESAGAMVGIGRLTPSGRVGRMAVLPDWRHLGVASGLLAAVVQLARQRGLARLHLHAQMTALGFYERYGWLAEGAVFHEAGIAHRAMSLELR
jgi:predicted GNAT family N-acyltransferase